MLRPSDIPISLRQPLHDHSGGARNNRRTLRADLRLRVLDTERRERGS